MMNVVQIKLSDLNRPKRNVRMHSQMQIDEYCKSIVKFGQIRPMVIDENNTILVGNGMYDALLQLGWETAACVIKADMSENEKKKLMLADNRIYSLGVDDIRAFDEIIAELAGDFDIPGYDDNLLNSLVADVSGVDEIMAGYGIIDEQDKAKMQKAAEQYERKEEEMATQAQEIKPVSQPVAMTSGASEPVYRDSPQEASATAGSETNNLTYPERNEPVQGAGEALQHKYLVCPHCGAKIWV